MNKFVLSLVIVAILAAGAGGVAFAQGQVPPSPQNAGSGYGAGRMGGRGAGMMGQGVAGSQSGYLHDEIVAAFAEELGFTLDELNARLAEGETISQIAISQGLTYEEFRTLMANARAQALDQAVADGKLTQQQADWMKQRGAGVMGGNGPGAGQGRFANPDCPYYAQPTP